MAALTGYMSGKWMSTQACHELREADAKSENIYKTIAFNCTNLFAERAKESVAVNEKINPETAKPTIKKAKMSLRASERITQFPVQSDNRPHTRFRYSGAHQPRHR